MGGVPVKSFPARENGQQTEKFSLLDGKETGNIWMDTNMPNRQTHYRQR